MNNLQNNQKSDAPPIGYDTLLAHVILACKCGVPIYKTIKKYNWSRDRFYRLSTPETIRYLNEIKSLKKSKRGSHCGSTYRRSDTADFNVC